MKFIFPTLMSILIGTSPIISAQQISRVQGNIYDAQTNQKLSFVNVIVVNSHYGTMANEKGHYTLKLPSGKHKILFSMIGYKTFLKEFKLNENQILNLDIFLTPTILYMPGITVIAPKTTQQKQNESVSSYAVGSRKIENLPFSFNDINRPLKTLPGVTSNNEKSSEFNVRGGSYDENLVLIDNVIIYRPFHLKGMPNASISVLNMSLMENVDLITGGFPARYGDKMSSVLNIKYREGRKDRIHSRLEVGVTNTNFSIEGPLMKNCSWLMGFNKSYFTQSIKMMRYYFPDFLKSIYGIPRFYDLQGKLNFEISRQHNFSLFFLNSRDDYFEIPSLQSSFITHQFSSTYVQLKTINESRFDSNSGNTILASQFWSRINNSIDSKFTFSYYTEIENLSLFSKNYAESKFYNNKTNEYRGFRNYDNIDRYVMNLNTKIFEYNYRLILKMNSYHDFETGLNYQRLHYFYKLNDFSKRIVYSNINNYPDTAQIDTLFYDDNFNDNFYLKSKTYKIGAYLQDSWQFKNHIFLNLGVRYDYFDLNKNSNFSPRIALSYSLDNGSIFKLAWGVYYQSPIYSEVRLKTASSNNTQNQKAIHYIIGYRQKIKETLDITIDTYYKRYQNIIPYYLRNGYKLSTQKNNAIGFAKGIDIQLKYNMANISGWLSYSLLKAEEKIKDNNQGYYPRPTDQRHTIAMVIDWPFRKKWQIIGKFLYGSGFPYTPKIFDFSSKHFVNGKINSRRLPPYSRADLRISREFHFSRVTCNIFFEIINLFHHKNIITYENYGFDENGNLSKVGKTLLPITPNIGLRISY